MDLNQDSLIDLTEFKQYLHSVAMQTVYDIQGSGGRGDNKNSFSNTDNNSSMDGWGCWLVSPASKSTVKVAYQVAEDVASDWNWLGLFEVGSSDNDYVTVLEKQLSIKGVTMKSKHILLSLLLVFLCRAWRYRMRFSAFGGLFEFEYEIRN